MSSVSSGHLVAATITLIGITLAGLYLSRRVTSTVEFTVAGRRASAALVVGTIMGTLLGGASTVGTAQLAFVYGFSAWWYTLGAGLGCLVLGTVIADPVRRSECETIPRLLADAYGPSAGPVSAFFSSITMFLTIVGQLLAAVAILATMFPLSAKAAAFVAALVAVLYVLGGIRGTGLLGLVKLALLYASLLVGGSVAYVLGEGLAGFHERFPQEPWFSLFGRGLADADAAVSMVIGVLSTQTYFQAVAAAKDVRTSKRGAWLCALGIPPIGVAGVFIGLLMRDRFPDLDPALALPTFIATFIPSWVGGVMLATLFITTIGTAAGMSLGISTIFTRDVYQRWVHHRARDRHLLAVSRLVIVAVLGVAMVLAWGRPGDFILHWVFLSFALRGAAVCLPLLGALFFRAYIGARAGVAAVIAAPTAALIGVYLAPGWVHPAYLGLAVSAMVLLSRSAVISGVLRRRPVTR